MIIIISYTTGIIYNEKSFSDYHLVLVLAWRALKTCFYELRMVTIGQDCSVVCINKGGH